MIFLVQNAAPETHYLINCFASLASATLGGLITYFYTQWRDARIEKNTVIGTCNSLAFALALQVSEFTRIKMDIEKRIDMLHKNNLTNRNDLITAYQEFRFFDLNVDIANATQIILPYYEKKASSTKVHANEKDPTSILQGQAQKLL